MVKDLTPEGFANEVDAEWQHLRGGRHIIPEDTIAAMRSFFAPSAYAVSEEDSSKPDELCASNRGFSRWMARNVRPHRHPGYAIVTLSLKKLGIPPGDATALQMDAVADIAERFSLGEVRVTHEQNLVLPHVARRHLFEVWRMAVTQGLPLWKAHGKTFARMGHSLGVW